MARVIKVDGSEHELSDVSLESLQAAVDGYIEAVHLPGGKVMIVNEEGLLIGLPVNAKAMDFLHQYGDLAQQIVGDVVVCEPGEIE